MRDEFMYRKLDAIRVILAIVQNGTDLCLHMQGSNRNIMFNIKILFVVEESFCVCKYQNNLPK